MLMPHNMGSRIEHARPVTVHPIRNTVDAETLDTMPKKDIITVLCWIDNNIYADPHCCTIKDSYQLKHMVEADTGVYLTNNQFKHAMLLCGYGPVDASELNWDYCISRDSAIFAWGRPDGAGKITKRDIENFLEKYPQYHD